MAAGTRRGNTGGGARKGTPTLPGYAAMDEWSEPTRPEAPAFVVPEAVPSAGEKPEEIMPEAAPEVAPEDVPSSAPPVEVVVHHERGASLGPWRVIDIWTRNRVYGLDANLVCIEVVNRANAEAEAGHPLLGARLIGGQRRDGRALHLTHPLPLPGTSAVFKHIHKRHNRLAQTSKVERVVLRVRVASAPMQQSEAFWDGVTGQRDLAPRAK